MKYVQFFAFQLYLNKAIKKFLKRKKSLFCALEVFDEDEIATNQQILMQS